MSVTVCCDLLIRPNTPSLPVVWLMFTGSQDNFERTKPLNSDLFPVSIVTGTFQIPAYLMTVLKPALPFAGSLCSDLCLLWRWKMGRKMLCN